VWWRNILTWSLTFGVALVIASVIGSGSHCCLAFSVTVILQVWIFRARWPAKFIRSNGGQFFTKEKKKQGKDQIDSGPFEPAIPLTSISDDSYFVEIEHRSYIPGNWIDVHYYELPAWIRALTLGILVWGLVFYSIWFSLYLGLCQYVDGVCGTRGDAKAALGLVGMPCVLILLIGAMAYSTHTLKPALINFKQTGALRKMMRLNRVRQIQNKGIPLVGKVVWYTCGDLDRFTKSGTLRPAKVIILEYVFVTPTGQQRMGIVYFAKDPKQPSPSPGAPLVVMYVDDDCHMPL
jgi:hypothetical protein